MRKRIALGVVAATAALAGSALAANINVVKIRLAPAAGKNGSPYNIYVSGTASTTYAELVFSMTASPAAACPASYSGGFASLSGIASSTGAPIAPAYVHGSLTKTVHAKITISQPGTYAVCAYLTLGRKTLAKAQAALTISG